MGKYIQCLHRLEIFAQRYDVLLLTVNHQAYLDMPRSQLLGCIRLGGVLMDVKSTFELHTMPANLIYWSL